MSSRSVFDSSINALVLHRSETTIQSKKEAPVEDKRQVVNQHKGRLGLSAASGGEKNLGRAYQPLGKPESLQMIINMKESIEHQVDAEKHRSRVKQDRGDLKEKEEQLEEAADHKEESGALLDVRRNRATGRVDDGFQVLKQYISESEERIKSVKKKVPSRIYGLDYSVNLFEEMLPDREDYPPATAKGARTERREETSSVRAAAQPRSGSLSARGPGKYDGGWGPRKVPPSYHRTCYISGCKRQRLPVKLDSLQEFVDYAGIYHPQEGKTGTSKPLAKDIREFTKRLDKAFEKEHEAMLRDKGLTPRTAKEKHSEGRADEKHAEQVKQDGSKAFGGDDRAPHDKVIKLLHPEPPLNPVMCLKEQLKSYAETRKEQKQKMQDTMYAMDLDRLPQLMRRGRHLHVDKGLTVLHARQLMRLEGEREHLATFLSREQQEQVVLYREMLDSVKGSGIQRRDLPRAVHFMLDFLQRVIEFGAVFTPDLLQTMLRKIDSEEFDHPDSGQLVSLVARELAQRSGGGVSQLVQWFKDERGACPAGILQDAPGKDAHERKDETFVTAQDV